MNITKIAKEGDILFATPSCMKYPEQDEDLFFMINKIDSNELYLYIIQNEKHMETKQSNTINSQKCEVETIMPLKVNEQYVYKTNQDGSVKIIKNNNLHNKWTGNAFVREYEYFPNRKVAFVKYIPTFSL